MHGSGQVTSLLFAGLRSADAGGFRYGSRFQVKSAFEPTISRLESKKPEVSDQPRNFCCQFEVALRNTIDVV